MSAGPETQILPHGSRQTETASFVDGYKHAASIANELKLRFSGYLLRLSYRVRAKLMLPSAICLRVILIDCMDC